MEPRIFYRSPEDREFLRIWTNRVDRFRQCVLLLGRLEPEWGESQVLWGIHKALNIPLRHLDPVWIGEMLSVPGIKLRVLNANQNRYADLVKIADRSLVEQADEAIESFRDDWKYGRLGQGCSTPEWQERQVTLSLLDVLAVMNRAESPTLVWNARLNHEEQERILAFEASLETSDELPQPLIDALTHLEKAGRVQAACRIIRARWWDKDLRADCLQAGPVSRTRLVALLCRLDPEAARSVLQRKTVLDAKVVLDAARDQGSSEYQKRADALETLLDIEPIAAECSQI